MLFVTHSIITPHPRPLTLLVCRFKGCKWKKGADTILKANNLDAHILLWKNWNVTWILSQIWFVSQNSFWTSFFLIWFSWMWLPWLCVCVCVWTRNYLLRFFPSWPPFVSRSWQNILLAVFSATFIGIKWQHSTLASLIRKGDNLRQKLIGKVLQSH